MLIVVIVNSVTFYSRLYSCFYPIHLWRFVVYHAHILYLRYMKLLLCFYNSKQPACIIISLKHCTIA